MKLSTKGRYAMVALVDIALHKDENLVTLGDVAKRQDISLPYLEQLFVKLRRANLVDSVRGPGGGYRLARPAADIRVSDVLAAVDETVDALQKLCLLNEFTMQKKKTKKARCRAAILCLPIVSFTYSMCYSRRQKRLLASK